MKKKFAQEALLSLLISFLANSSDIIELFAYIDEEKILPHKSLVVQILSKPYKSSRYQFRQMCIYTFYY